MDNNADDLALVEKTIEAIKDIATSITANSAIGPKPDPEQAAETTNEQLSVPPSEPELAIANQTHMDDVVAAEAAPALIATKKTAPKKRRAAPKKSAKQVAQPVAKNPKKTAKKTAKK